jgi:hypothetical protein
METGHRWTYYAGYQCCSCGEMCSEKPLVHVGKDACREWFEAHLAAVGVVEEPSVMARSACPSCGQEIRGGEGGENGRA